MSDDRTTRAALVLETNNLRGGDPVAAVAGLKRLLLHLRAQTRPLDSLAEVVITHDGLPEGARDRLENAAGVPLTFVEIAPATGYYEAKNVGFDATTAEVVAFADADCWPDPAWLDRLLAPFEKEDAAIGAVAGCTTYRPGAFGTALTSIDFMYFRRDRGATRNFYANNVAFRREVFAARRYERVLGQYRGACQVLGLRLDREGVRVLYVPEAHTVHRLPDTLGELVKLRLFRGADTTRLTPHLAATHLPAPLRWAARLEPLASLGVLAARFAFSARHIADDPQPRFGLLRRAAALGLMAAVSAIDAAGALASATGLTHFGLEGKGDGEVLSYHANVDGLDVATAA